MSYHSICLFTFIILDSQCPVWLILDVAMSLLRSFFEDLLFCDKFHLEETGWRECSLCNKVNLKCCVFFFFPSYFLPFFSPCFKIFLPSFFISFFFFFLIELFKWQRIHCGCIMSKPLYECLDLGGVECISCAKSSGLYSVRFTNIIVLKCCNHCILAHSVMLYMG